MARRLLTAEVMNLVTSTRTSRSTSLVLGAACAGLLAALTGCSTAAPTEAENASLCSPSEVVAANDAQAKSFRLNGMRLNGMRLNGAKLSGVELNGIRLNGVGLNGTTLNGTTLNGTTINGIDLNGTTLNGFRLNGMRMNGPVLQGTHLQGTTLNGPVLQGTTLNGVVLNGEGSKGAELVGQLSDGSTIPIYIEAVRKHSDPVHADVTLYQVSYGKERAPLCGLDESGAPVLATALANTWDMATGARIDTKDSFTFACQGGALYKCVEAGYKPWKSVEGANGPVSLADLHQACTRMIRADYCGDGQSYTLDRTEIDVYDGLGIQSPESLDHATFAFEASWGPDGATCVAKTRYPLPALPQCILDRMSDACGTTPEVAHVGAGVTPSLMNRSSTENRCLVK